MMCFNYGAAISEVTCFSMHISNLNGISSFKATFIECKVLKLSHQSYYWSNWAELSYAIILNNGNYFSGGNRSSDWNKEYYFILLFTCSVVLAMSKEYCSVFDGKIRVTHDLIS
jgi:hypothetical protein